MELCRRDFVWSREVNEALWLRRISLGITIECAGTVKRARKLTALYGEAREV